MNYYRGSVEIDFVTDMNAALTDDHYVLIVGDGGMVPVDASLIARN